MAAPAPVRVARLLLAALVVVGCHTAAPPGDRPTHLVDLPVGSIERIDVRDPATGRTGHLVRGDAALEGLEGDLAPLLAIRLLDRRRPDYGLDPPRLDVTITTASRTVHLLVGGPNFDDTAVYVGIGSRTALVLPSIATTLAAVLVTLSPSAPGSP
ncbi:MAG: hypothetical protein JWO68_2889 [Actinomycetia bacterium]|nr:hypothetical protein [Actinomycetes bacterium]